MDEILVKGNDGKWYILRGEELLPYDETGKQVSGKQVAGVQDLPKGVTKETHERLEKPQTSSTKSQTITKFQIVSSKPAPLLLPPSHESHSLSKELEELVEKVVAEAKGTWEPGNRGTVDNEVLQKRLRMIVSARLRDVRDSVETSAMLTRGQKVGGLEMQKIEAERVGAIIEKAFQEFQAKWKAVEQKRREEWKIMQSQQRQELEQRQQQTGQEELEDRYKRLVAKNTAVPRQQPAGDMKEAAGSAFFGTRSVTDGSKLESSTSPRSSSARSAIPLVESTQAGLRVSSGGSSQQLPQQQAIGRNTLSPPVPIPKREEKRDQVPQRTTSKPYTLDPRPSGKVTDIRPVPKLTGPLEELSRLTLQDFRRLGSTASENAAKISAKIDRLHTESLARRGQGLAAWRSSPLQQLYGQIMSEALERRISPAALLTEKQPAPMTPEEFNAIMELNQKLRF